MSSLDLLNSEGNRRT